MAAIASAVDPGAIPLKHPFFRGHLWGPWSKNTSHVEHVKNLPGNTAEGSPLSWLACQKHRLGSQQPATANCHGGPELC